MADEERFASGVDEAGMRSRRVQAERLSTTVLPGGHVLPRCGTDAPQRHFDEASRRSVFRTRRVSVQGKLVITTSV